MLRDFCTSFKATRGISPAAAVTDNTPFVSQIVDTLDFDSVTFLAQLGAIADADATFVVLVEHGDNSGLSDATAVPDADLIGTEAGMAFLFSDDNKCAKIGYKGTKRYVRVTITPSANSGNIFLSGTWLLGHPRTMPQSTQITA